MTLRETSKFSKLRKTLKDRAEREALKTAVIAVLDDPQAGKKLKGELEHLRSFPNNVRGQARCLIYLLEKDATVLFSFGPR